jgi:Translin family
MSHSLFLAPILPPPMPVTHAGFLHYIEHKTLISLEACQDFVGITNIGLDLDDYLTGLAGLPRQLVSAYRIPFMCCLQCVVCNVQSINADFSPTSLTSLTSPYIVYRSISVQLCYQTRLCVNCVIAERYDWPAEISRFVNDLYGGYRLLNLKNGDLRRKFDGIKYSVQKIEEVMYDVSVRKLNESQ